MYVCVFMYMCVCVFFYVPKQGCCQKGIVGHASNFFLPSSFYVVLYLNVKRLRPVVPKIAGLFPTEAVGFFQLEKSTACLPSEGK
jgi:hypothetical protein